MEEEGVGVLQIFSGRGKDVGFEGVVASVWNFF